MPAPLEAQELSRQSDEGAPLREKAWPPNSRTLAGDPVAPLVNANRLDALLAQRASAHVPKAPVVHVHIDRLEVRAPPVPQRAAPSMRGRPAVAGTLSDYLRGTKR